MSGIFISFEGIDFSGKTEQARRLFETLRAAGYDVELLREPGGVEIAEAIRHILLDAKNSGMTVDERYELMALMQIYQLGQLRKSEALAAAVRRGLRTPLQDEYSA
jgi:thymidylate kinase